jgi:hypothetical protein
LKSLEIEIEPRLFLNPKLFKVVTTSVLMMMNLRKRRPILNTVKENPENVDARSKDYLLERLSNLSFLEN